MTLPALNATRNPSFNEPVPPVTLPWASLTSLPAQAAVVRVLPARSLDAVRIGSNLDQKPPSAFSDRDESYQ